MVTRVKLAIGKAAAVLAVFMALAGVQATPAAAAQEPYILINSVDQTVTWTANEWGYTAALGVTITCGNLPVINPEQDEISTQVNVWLTQTRARYTREFWFMGSAGPCDDVPHRVMLDGAGSAPLPGAVIASMTAQLHLWSWPDYGGYTLASDSRDRVRVRFTPPRSR